MENLTRELVLEQRRKDNRIVEEMMTFISTTVEEVWVKSKSFILLEDMEVIYSDKLESLDNYSQLMLPLTLQEFLKNEKLFNPKIMTGYLKLSGEIRAGHIVANLDNVDIVLRNNSMTQFDLLRSHIVYLVQRHWNKNQEPLNLKVLREYLNNYCTEMGIAYNDYVESDLDKFIEVKLEQDLVCIYGGEKEVIPLGVSIPEHAYVSPRDI